MARVALGKRAISQKPSLKALNFIIICSLGIWLLDNSNDPSQVEITSQAIK
jgi:hypothetical protein